MLFYSARSHEKSGQESWWWGNNLLAFCMLAPTKHVHVLWTFSVSHISFYSVLFYIAYFLFSPKNAFMHSQACMYCTDLHVEKQFLYGLHVDLLMYWLLFFLICKGSADVQLVERVCKVGKEWLQKISRGPLFLFILACIQSERLQCNDSYFRDDAGKAWTLWYFLHVNGYCAWHHL
jgi:hypothetical protein